MVRRSSGRLPRIRFALEDHSLLGPKSRFHGVVISCAFPSKPADESDHVDLEVVLGDAYTESPMIAFADVTWGHPNLYIEAELLPNPVPFSTEQLAKLIEQLPILFAALERALERGRPPD